MEFHGTEFPVKMLYILQTYREQNNALKKKFKKKDVPVIMNVKSGRPQTPAFLPGTQPGTSNEKRSPLRNPRSSVVQYDPNRCIFCNEDGTRQEINQVCSFDVGRKIREIFETSNNSDWKVRLQPLSPDDARTIDIMYSLVCYITVSRRFSKPSKNSKEK